MCRWGSNSTVTLCRPNPISGRVTVEVDTCIAPLVQAINDAGIRTLGACCGHTKNAGGIIVEVDGVAGEVVVLLDLFPDSHCSVRSLESLDLVTNPAQTPSFKRPQGGFGGSAPRWLAKWKPSILAHILKTCGPTRHFGDLSKNPHFWRVEGKGDILNTAGFWSTFGKPARNPTFPTSRLFSGISGSACETAHFGDRDQKRAFRTSRAKVDISEVGRESRQVGRRAGNLRSRKSLAESDNSELALRIRQCETRRPNRAFRLGPPKTAKSIPVGRTRHCESGGPKLTFRVWVADFHISGFRFQLVKALLNYPRWQTVTNLPIDPVSLVGVAGEVVLRLRIAGSPGA